MYNRFLAASLRQFKRFRSGLYQNSGRPVRAVKHVTPAEVVAAFVAVNPSARKYRRKLIALTKGWVFVVDEKRWLACHSPKSTAAD